MIKINLLPQRKARRSADPGQRDLVIGVAVLAAVASLLVVLVHAPVSREVKRLRADTAAITADSAPKKKTLRDAENLKKAVAAAEERSGSIDRLMRAKAVPAHLLQELSDILTAGQLPTMTREMATRISEGPQGDANRRIALDWDPKHVWITSFAEKGGVFTLEGGAQSDGDVTQLAKRMQASVYFQDVSPRGGERLTDRDSGITYYKFTITGKVVY